MSNKTVRRIYAVKTPDHRVRLVEAASPGQAVGHVYGDENVVSLPTQRELFEYGAQNIVIEKAPTRSDQGKLPLVETA